MSEGWVNCDNCGARYGSWIASCPKCGATNKARRIGGGMGKGKKIAIGGIIAVVGFFAVTLGIASFASIESNTSAPGGSAQELAATETKTLGEIQQQLNEQNDPLTFEEMLEKGKAQQQQQSSNIFTGSLSTLLPVRADIGTEWRIGDRSDSIDSGATEAKGYQEGLEQRYTKGSGFDIAILDLSLYKFDSAQDAKQYYSELVSGIKEEGGYKEVNFGSGLDAECYGTTTEYTMSTYHKSYCVQQNIYYHVQAFSGAAWYEDTDLMEFTKIVTSKVS